MIVMGTPSWRAGQTLQRLELAVPEPGPGEVRVGVHSIGVNPVDWKMRESGPLRLAARFLSFFIGPKPPVVIGVDFAGIVEAVGAGVQSCKVGDRVVGGTNFSRGQRGSYADTVLVRADQVCLLEDSVSMEVAACLPVAGVTAHMALHDYTKVGPKSKVLVLGASGGVGQFAVQLAKRVIGVGTVAGVCSSKNAGLVTDLGADIVFAYDQVDPLQAALAHGPYDLVVDGVGSYAGSACRKLLAPGGTHVMIAGDKPSNMMQIFIPPFRSKAILGTPDGAHLAPLVQAVAHGLLKVNIAHRLHLLDAEEAHALSKSSRIVGKIVLAAR